MYLISSIFIALIFALCFNEQIKKYSRAFYILALILTIFVGAYYQFHIKDIAPEWVTKYVVNIFKRGAFSTGIFTVVMYTAVLNKKWTITKKLYKVRGELAIIGAIITFGHNFVYGFTGKAHFIHLFAGPDETEIKYIIAKILSLIMILMLIPLTITSFRSIRNKMTYSNWKNIQRLAYPFYILTYIHVMVLYLSKINKKFSDIIVYTIVFGGYIILRLVKYSIDKKNKKNA